MARIGVMGGTFDPVHLGHLVLAESAREQLALRRVFWVPAGDPWRKANRSVTTAARRRTMVELAIAENSAFRLCPLEIDKDGPSYSVDTLEELSRQHPRDELYFLLGLDALQDLPKWHDPDRLIELAVVAVAPRGEERLSKRELDRLLPRLSRRVVWVKMAQVDITATKLRERAAGGQSLRYLVPDAVATYIRRWRLYRER